MKQEQKTAWIRDNRCRADNSIRALTSARKQVTADYDERLRKLKDLAEVLFIKELDDSQEEMFKPEEILSPDLVILLEFPMRGLE